MRDYQVEVAITETRTEVLHIPEHSEEEAVEAAYVEAGDAYPDAEIEVIAINEVYYDAPEAPND